jgi:hypothetical protein
MTNDRQLPAIDEDAFSRAIADIANTVKPQRSSRPPELFVSIGKKLGETLIHSAEEQVKTAQENLVRVKDFAERLEKEIDRRDQEHSNFMDRLVNFGRSILDANQKFYDGSTK